MTRDEILAAIRRAAEELGRAPSRGELRRITGVSHYRVLAEFPTLREAVRAAGLEPNPKGEKDQHGRFAGRLESGGEAGKKAVASGVCKGRKVQRGRADGAIWELGEDLYHRGHREGKSVHRGVAEARRKAKEIGRELTRRSRINQTSKKANHKGHEEAQRESGGLAQSARLAKPGESVLHNFIRVPLARVPSPLVGMRRVMEAVAQMVVNMLMGARSGDLVIGTSGDLHPTTRNARVLGTPGDQLIARGIRKEGDLGPSLAVNAPLVQDDRRRRADFTARGLYKDRPVMGEPFDGRR